MNAEQGKLFTELRDDVLAIKQALIGDPDLKTTGIIDELKGLKKKMDDHEAIDEKNFKMLFQYQENQQLFLGWSRWAIGLACSFLMAFGGLLAWALTTLIPLLRD